MCCNGVIVFKEADWSLVSNLDVRQVTIEEESAACLWLKDQCSGFKNSKPIKIKELLAFETLSNSFV